MPLCYNGRVGERTHREPFGAWLRRERTRAGLRLRDVAEVANIGISYVSLLEREGEKPDGKQTLPSRQAVIGIARALGVDPDEALLRAGLAPEIRYDRWLHEITWEQAVRRAFEQVRADRDYEPNVLAGYPEDTSLPNMHHIVRAYERATGKRLLPEEGGQA